MFFANVGKAKSLPLFVVENENGMPFGLFVSLEGRLHGEQQMEAHQHPRRIQIHVDAASFEICQVSLLLDRGMETLDFIVIGKC